MLSIAFVLVACGQATPPPGATVAGAAGESGAAPARFAEVIFVVPPKGAPDGTGLILADAVAAELRDNDRPAILSFEPNQAGASVVAEVTGAEPHGNVLWLTLDWAIRAPYGTHVASHTQRVVVDAGMWRSGAPEAINLLIDDAAPKIVAMVQAEVRPPSEIVMTRPSTEPAPAPQAPATVAPQSATTPPRSDPRSEPRSEPLARIADVHQRPGGARPRDAAGPNRHGVRPGLGGRRRPNSDGGRRRSGPAATADPIPADAAPVSDRPELPSLLTPPGAAAPAGPPTPLVPGQARTVAPPPGGTVAAAENDDDGVLGALMPNMNAAARRPGDARPAGPGGAAFAQVRWGQPSFLIRPVKGAPGNGNEALTAALKSALRGRDVTISEDPRQAGFVIDGTVEMGPPASGRQYVRIVWRVDTVTGETVGQAVQETPSSPAASTVSGAAFPRSSPRPRSGGFRIFSATLTGNSRTATGCPISPTWSCRRSPGVARRRRPPDPPPPPPAGPGIKAFTGADRIDMFRALFRRPDRIDESHSVQQ